MTPRAPQPLSPDVHAALIERARQEAQRSPVRAMADRWVEMTPEYREYLVAGFARRDGRTPSTRPPVSVTRAESPPLSAVPLDAVRGPRTRADDPPSPPGRVAGAESPP